MQKNKINREKFQHKPILGNLECSPSFIFTETSDRSNEKLTRRNKGRYAVPLRNEIFTKFAKIRKV